MPPRRGVHQVHSASSFPGRFQGALPGSLASFVASPTGFGAVGHVGRSGVVVIRMCGMSSSIPGAYGAARASLTATMVRWPAVS